MFTKPITLDAYFNGTHWVKAKFYRMYRLEDTVQWAKKTYGEPQPNLTWWCDYLHITMNEKIYLHWQLAK